MWAYHAGEQPAIVPAVKVGALVPSHFCQLDQATLQQQQQVRLSFSVKWGSRVGFTPLDAASYCCLMLWS